jgi:hypothetical protein
MRPASSFVLLVALESLGGVFNFHRWSLLWNFGQARLNKAFTTRLTAMGHSTTSRRIPVSSAYVNWFRLYLAPGILALPPVQSTLLANPLLPSQTS